MQEQAKNNRFNIRYSVNINGYVLEKSINFTLLTEDINNPSINAAIPIHIRTKSGGIIDTTITVHLMKDDTWSVSSAVKSTENDIKLIIYNIDNARPSALLGLTEKGKIANIMDGDAAVGIYMDYTINIFGGNIAIFTINIYSKEE